jgi:two-component system cell cycle sensor histidine kinase/response regulator CckA
VTNTKAHLESATFLQSMLEALPIYLAVLDDEDRIRYVNRLGPGLAHDQVIGRSTFDFVAPEYHALHRQALNAARANGGLHSYLVKAQNLHGAPAHFETQAIGVARPEGGYQVYVAALEVTAHVARTEALRESEEKLRVAVEASGIGLWSWDFASGAHEWSPRMCEILGLTQGLTVEEYIARCVHPEDRSLAMGEVGLARQGEPRFPAHRVVRSDGEVRWVAPFGRLTLDDAGNPVRMHGGTLDITAQRQTEERLRQMQKLDAVGGLTAGVAHNFNNVLAVILPAIETALRDPGLDGLAAIRRRLEDAGEAARRAANLVSQLMTSAGQRMPETRTAVDLHGLLQGLLSMCRQTFDRRCQIELHCERVPPPVRGDAGALEQVFLNLMMNARDAVLDGQVAAPRIDVELRVHGGEGSGAPTEVRIVVRDNGPGMTEAVRARLFEPFFTTKPLGHGTGLGLATSLATVRGHNGRMELRSAPFEGTVCEVALPCLPAAAAHATLADTATTPRLAPRSRILLVDDEAPIRGVIREVLESVGHEVADAESAEQAVIVLQGGFAPELVLLDRSMPGWPVRRAVAELRACADGASIVFFTGQSVPDDEAELVDGVLHKPMSVDELHYAVGRFLGRRR